jgi:hypothetical protein
MSPAAQKFLSRNILVLFFYLSDSGETSDYSVTTRRDFFHGCINEFRRLNPKERKEVLDAFSRNARAYDRHPLKHRFRQFLSRFKQALNGYEDASFLGIDLKRTK